MPILESQINALSALPSLEELPRSEAAILAQMAVLRAYNPNTYIPIATLRMRHCYVILEGTATSIGLDREGKQISFGTLQAGDFYGHSMLFANRTLLYELQTQTRLYVLQWTIERIREKFVQLPTFIRLLEEKYTRRRAISTLSRVPIFTPLSPELRLVLANHLVRQSFERNSVIFEQDTVGKSLYLIEQGQVAVEQDGIIIATLSEGDFFGEMALFGHTTHNATIRTITAVKCWVLPGSVFSNLMNQETSLEAGVREVIDNRIQQAHYIHNDSEQQRFLQIAVRYGMLRGSHVLVRRPALCPPDCNLCEQACAERFGQARLKLNGVDFDQWDVTTSCRQCQENAECVESCPEDAIVWDSKRQAYKITDACTGCGNCVTACPYEAVQSQTIELESRNGPLWQLWRKLQTNPPIPKQRIVASKCDLCIGYADQACLSICPTGSLQLLPIEELFP